MPELPEVETTVAGLKRYVEGQTIHRVTFHRDNIRYPLSRAWIAKIEGKTVVAVKRRAKLIIMQLQSREKFTGTEAYPALELKAAGRVGEDRIAIRRDDATRYRKFSHATVDSDFLLWHLGMSGSLRVSNADEAQRRHDHVEMHLSDGRILRYHDPRRFGYLKWFADEAALLADFAHYGVEPLQADFNGEYLHRLSRKKKQAVKNFIMNQAIVVGVGNIYACEALFAAGIRPQTPCGGISLPRYRRLVTAIQQVLEKAIQQGGTTLKDFENADAQPGYFQQTLAVYGREGEACPGCQSPIVAVKLGGRNSFYCRQCQR